MIHSDLNLLGRYSCLQHRFCGRYSIYNKAGHFLYQSRHCTNILTIKHSCWSICGTNLVYKCWLGKEIVNTMNKELWSKAQMELEAMLSEQGKLLLVFHEEKCCSGERYDHGTSSDTSMIWAGSYFSHQTSSTEQRFVRRESCVDHIPQDKELSAMLIDGFGEGKVCHLNITLCWLQHTDS